MIWPLISFFVSFTVFGCAGAWFWPWLFDKLDERASAKRKAKFHFERLPYDPTKVEYWFDVAQTTAAVED